MVSKSGTLRERLYIIIFEHDSPAGKLFDVILILSILLSVVAVMLDSVKAVNQQYGSLLYAIEWLFTILFSIEYLLRLSCIGKPVRYAKSFFGIVDLLAILPTYLSMFVPGSQFLIAIRVLRILRTFRVLKLVQYMNESQQLMQALWASRRKITVFLFAVFTLVIIFGSCMYLIEGEENGFTSIPRSVYWAIVTMTTVGYGDISPKTPFGQMIASVIMIMGYGIIAVPTGIVTAELTSRKIQSEAHIVCPECSSEDHGPDADFCKKCGAKLREK
ncbi:MAG: ion transporter [Nitrospira sp.]|nr:ion transporter [Nitrospira sp.]